ncbi:uncharacterized protein J4E78_008296 [Alternaria triticimaculans]|uniref:uncharacterized protein n=1 Tax=Alternaria triticimaculans TaxID=297637 RepID=UPI0020C1F788|nr:uncharacterized protein J4E78_008296 [Alternaria triticimaculans]KAI4650015.1 hypothetical protein J4E78_008296 [Alternaria triticimaculans]
MTNVVDMPFSDIDDSDADLYAMDLPLSLAGELAAQQATTHCANVSGSTQSEQLELQATPEPPPSPPFFKPASWNAIDAATAEYYANMQQEIAAQELRDVKRCLDLRHNIARTAKTKIFDSEPLVVPSSWSMSGVHLKSLVKHPFLLEEYLEGEHFSREAIRIRREYFEIKHCGSPEIKRLAAMEADYRESQASRSLLDLLLEAIQHATQKLILELTEGDKTTKRPVLDLCRRLVAYSTHTDDDGELIRAVEAINDIERGHMQLQYDNVLERSTETSSKSSMPHAVAPPDSPPPYHICLPAEPASSPPPVETSPPKDPSRLRVKFQENLTLLSSDIGHLTHPIVMMALEPPPVASRPADLTPAPHTIIRPVASRPTPIRPEATLSPGSSLANTGKKRRASRELAATSDCETNPTKRPNRSERDGNAHSAQVESRDANVEIGNTARPTCPTPSPQMQAALAEACRKRDERQSNQWQLVIYKRDEYVFWKKEWRRFEDTDNEA